MARLRAERASLLGYPNHAAYVLEEQTAQTVVAVNERLASLVPPAVANARREERALQSMAADHGNDVELASWDWSYYAEKVRAERYDFDASELRPFFEMNHVLENGVFSVGGHGQQAYLPQGSKPWRWAASKNTSPIHGKG